MALKIEDFSTEQRKVPWSVYTFLTYLLKLDNKEKDLKLKLDFLHGVTSEKIITAKHFLMTLRVHNKTGQKHVDIVNKLGHSLNYHRTSKNEIAQAETLNRCHQSEREMIYMIIIVAFQEKLVKAIQTERKVSNIPKSGRLSFISDITLTLDITVNTKKPSRFDSFAYI